MHQRFWFKDLYAFLRDHPGTVFTTEEVRALPQFSARKAVPTTFHAVKRAHPSTIVVAQAGNMLTICYKPSGSITPAAPASPPKGDADVDVLVTIPIGANGTATLTAAQARRVYEQLHALFGGK